MSSDESGTRARMLKAGYSELACEVYEKTGRRSAALSAMAYYENDEGEVVRTGRVKTPKGEGVLIDAKGGVARVLVHKDNERAKAAKKKKQKRPRIKEWEADTRLFGIKEVTPIS